MSKLRAIRDGLGRGDHSPGTTKGYACDWRLFERWCLSCGREALPVSEDTLSLYVTGMLVERGRKVATAERHVAAVSHFHRAAGLPNPVSAKVRDVMTGIRRLRLEQPKGKSPLDPAALVRAVRSCDPTTNLGARDRALLVLGFATSLRRSELVRLQLADVSFEKKGLAVIVRKSKQDQEGQGRLLGVWAGKRACTDPVRVLRAWLLRRGRWAGPLFCRVQTGDVVIRRPITGDAVADVVKKVASRAGLDPADYGAHSLRAGAITACAQLGRSDQEIMGFSGHEDEKVMRMYIRPSRVFAGRNPLAGAL